MRFYQMSYRDWLELPIAVFWQMNGNIDRMMAETDLRLLTVTQVASAADGEAANQLRKQLTQELGEVVKMSVMHAPRDREGLMELKNMTGMHK